MSMLGLVVVGLRTWICTIAAPALAASIEDCAICSGVTGTAGLRPGVSAEPVTAHEMMTLRCMGASLLSMSARAGARFCSEAYSEGWEKAQGFGVLGSHDMAAQTHVDARARPLAPHCALR